MVQYSYANVGYYMSLFGDIFKKPKASAIYEIKSPNGQLDCVFVLDHGQMSYFAKNGILSVSTILLAPRNNGV